MSVTVRGLGKNNMQYFFILLICSLVKQSLVMQIIDCKLTKPRICAAAHHQHLLTVGLRQRTHGWLDKHTCKMYHQVLTLYIEIFFF